MVHPAQGKNLLCMPERSFDNKPFKRVYYENTALLIPPKQWIWINLKCGILISLKNLNKLKNMQNPSVLKLVDWICHFSLENTQ